MTKLEARKVFNLKENDTISEDGVRQILKQNIDRLESGHFPKYEKEKIEKEIEACEELLR